jgi:hypothetical protein
MNNPFGYHSNTNRLCKYDWCEQQKNPFHKMMMISVVLDKHIDLEFLYSVSSLKQPLTGRHGAPLETQYPEQTSLYCYSLMLMRDLWGSSNIQF